MMSTPGSVVPLAMFCNILPNTCGLMGIHLSNLYIIGSGPHRTKIAEFADPCAEKLLFFLQQTPECSIDWTTEQI